MHGCERFMREAIALALDNVWSGRGGPFIEIEYSGTYSTCPLRCKREKIAAISIPSV